MRKIFKNADFVSYGLVVVLSLIICVYVYQKEQPKPEPIDGYERISYVLATTGVFSWITCTDNPPPQVGRAPLYPVFASLFVRMDPDYKEYLECSFIEKNKDCVMEARGIYIGQAILYVFMTISIFLIARIVGGGRVSSIFFALFGLYIFAEQGVHYRLSEGVALPLFAICSLFVARHFSGRSSICSYVVLGVVLALLVLARVAYIYMVPILVLSLLFIPVAGKVQNMLVRFRNSVIVAAVFLAVLAPWLYRSHALTGHMMIGQSGISGVLAIRAEYNKMNLEEALAGFVYWIPGSGDSLAKKMFPEEVWKKYDASSKESFRAKGFKRSRALDKEGVPVSEIKKIIIPEIKADLVKHGLVSVLLAWRGLRYSLPLIPFFIGGFFVFMYRKNWWVIGLLMPSIFNLLFHAGFSHFHPRYGYPIVIGAAPLAAFFASWLWEKRKVVRGKEGTGEAVG